MAKMQAGAPEDLPENSLILPAGGANEQPSSVESILSLCRTGLIGPRDLANHAEATLHTWNKVFDRAKPFQQAKLVPEWLFDDEYQEVRGDAELLLDLLGYLPGEPVKHALREALQLTDPRLKLFAALSLIRRGEPVGTDQIEPIAASNEVREILWDELSKLGMQPLMPEYWRSPEALAESALSRWLTHPNELNALPEEIELMKTFPAEDDEGRAADVYLFRYREYPKPWEPGEGWMAGIAGRYPDGEEFDSAWSGFKRWDSMTPEEHFENLYFRDGGCSCE